ncbi:MAG: Unknown protein [uncultured Sulfurovum sp.]|uniref:Peptidase C14 caspase domain-containing protein n=1 Tax=uncultured Sulfurovum sp. TaxID=269237 RepID=A0A6S6TWM8_9BACT|nr:MAG: Unknown protein [uncultured Sulfurovum sp.]
MSLMLTGVSYAKVRVNENPNLHVLTISLDNYKNKAWNLQYCNSDANEFIKTLKKNGKNVFKNVYTYSLRDSQVTQNHVQSVFKKVATKIKSKDVFILYMGGHGSNIKGSYYFFSYDNTENRFKDQAISSQFIVDGLNLLSSSKLLVLIDSSHSGQLVDDYIKDTSTKKDGAIAFLSSSSSKQMAMDGYKGHGLFTYALIDAMNSSKIFGNDEKLSVNELINHVKNFVPKVAKEKFNHAQNPTIYTNGDTSFAIGGF